MVIIQKRKKKQKIERLIIKPVHPGPTEVPFNEKLATQVLGMCDDCLLLVNIRIVICIANNLFIDYGNKFLFYNCLYRSTLGSILPKAMPR